jgi:hypothetical protein
MRLTTLQSRDAARKEIIDQQAWECEDMYEDALWLLYTVRDELLPQRGHDWGAAYQILPI